VSNSAGSGSYASRNVQCVERDQHPPVQAPERLQHTLCRDRLKEQWIECGRRGSVQHQADIGIGRDRGHAEQGLTVRPRMPFFQLALMRQEGRTAHEEQGERRQTDIGHGVSTTAQRSGPPVGKPGADVLQSANEVLQRVHPTIESEIEPGRHPQSCSTPGLAKESPQAVAIPTHTASP